MSLKLFITGLLRFIAPGSLGQARDLNRAAGIRRKPSHRWWPATCCFL